MRFERIATDFDAACREWPDRVDDPRYERVFAGLFPFLPRQVRPARGELNVPGGY